MSSMIQINEEKTDDKYGYRPDTRPVNVLIQYGVIPLDKPRGPSSHEVVSWVRRIVGVEKAGHSGTLDPPVSGMLPVGLGRATKALGILLSYPKEYYAVMRLHSSVPENKVKEVFEEFTGEIYQRPPQRSSVKRETRTRKIYELEIVEQKGNLYLVRCLCQAGTYVRKLVYDIGEVLGVGATMVELRRTKVGPLDEREKIVTLHQLFFACSKLKSGDESEIRKVILPVETCLGEIKKVFVRDSAVDSICHGARLAVPGIISISSDIEQGDKVALMTAKGELIALGRALYSSKQIEGMKKGIVFTTDRVIMTPGTYPMMWKKEKSETS
jgi:H/ACA ribonucleoprotein complex subunit 4